jgi:squalene-associated FAD-dependent desaturase
MSATKRAAVVGAGWSGCAAAMELARKGVQVTLFESARTLGGRARAVEVQGRTLDNGQHIMLGAYRETLRLMARAGVAEKDAFLSLPLQMRYPPGQGMDFVAPRLPAPFHLAVALLRAKGLEREDKLALARFSTSARWMGWTLHRDCSVLELMERFDQTPRLYQLMWRPLCLAALNTAPEQASAKVFLAVLRDSLGARRRASDMLVPRPDLGALFPDAAARYVEARGGKVETGRKVAAIARADGAWTVDGERFDMAIVATPAPVAAALLAPHGIDIPAFDYEPIATVYLQYGPALRLALPFYALVDNGAAGDWGQFVFDRGQLDPAQAGLLSVVISAQREAAALDQDALAALVAGQLARALGNDALARPAWRRVITEKRATFACTPDLERPAVATGLAGLALAGDYTAGEYPATLEGAVRSGQAAAVAALAPRI